MTALRNLLPAHPQVEVDVTETGWTPVGDMSFEQWEAAGSDLLRMGRAWQWWIGDWILYGEQHYGEMYTDAINATGLEYQTLKNIIWVSRAVEKSRRRDLPWSLHAEIAPLDPPQQDEWLDRAEHEGMTRERLRAALRDLKRPTTTPAPEPAATFVAEVAFVFAADDQTAADARLADIVTKLERQGLSVTFKHIKTRH